jgi:alpha-tubulin suppressor-like RCC1 family protein
VYSFGNNEFGDLELGQKIKIYLQKINFENDERIIKIFCTCHCCAAFFYSSFFYFVNFINLIFIFLEKKNLFSCGLNDANQKGIFNNTENLTIPTKIDFFKVVEINQIFTGCSSTFVKTKSYFLSFIFYFLKKNNY